MPNLHHAHQATSLPHSVYPQDYLEPEIKTVDPKQKKYFNSYCCSKAAHGDDEILSLHRHGYQNDEPFVIASST